MKKKTHKNFKKNKYNFKKWCLSDVLQNADVPSSAEGGKHGSGSLVDSEQGE